jgi:hypothetical protein
MNEPGRATSVHHVVFAVTQEQLGATAQFFSELGFRFQTIELEDVGLRVLLDWDGGLELVTALSSGADGDGRGGAVPAAQRPRRFLGVGPCR